MSLLLTRGQVLAILRAHSNQVPDRGDPRCERCHHTDHPCDLHHLAVDWLAMDDDLSRAAGYRQARGVTPS